MSLRTVVAIAFVCLAAGQDPSEMDLSISEPHFRPADEAMLLQLRDRGDVAGLRRHAWDVLAQITRRTRSGYPVWQTKAWKSPADLFPPAKPDTAPVKAQNTPAQQTADAAEVAPPDFLGGIGPAGEVEFGRAAQKEDQKHPHLFLLSSIRYNPVAYHHIKRYALNNVEKLKAIIKRQDELETAAVPGFPRDAVIVKAAWWLVQGEGFTTLPVWDPPDTDLKPRRKFNDWPSWRRCVAIDPDNRAEGTMSPKLPCTDSGEHEWPVVSLSRFYHVQLTPEDLRRLSSVPKIENLVNGVEGSKYAVLVGLHITTKEIPDWVWETIWWHDEPASGPYAADRPANVEAPWNNYLMDTTMSSDTPHEPDEQPKICFNPWLEGHFLFGSTANCVTCHRRASYPSDNSAKTAIRRGTCPPPRDGRIVLLDFIWSLSQEQPSLHLNEDSRGCLSTPN